MVLSMLLKKKLTSILGSILKDYFSDVTFGVLWLASLSTQWFYHDCIYRQNSGTEVRLIPCFTEEFDETYHKN